MEGWHKVSLVLVIVGLIVKEGWAAQHAVGGSQGWDESTDYTTWSSAQTFKVGDQLVFKYTAGLHSVVELSSESAYKKCDITSSKDSLSTGNDVVKLDKAGTRYFACGTSGHCGQGMKLKITTVSADSSSSPAASSSSSSSSSSPASSSSNSSPTSTSSNSSPTSTSAASNYASFVSMFALLATGICLLSLIM